MEIALIILANLIILGGITLSIILGIKKGFIYSLLNLLTFCGICVGSYFLQPTIISLFKIELSSLVKCSILVGLVIVLNTLAQLIVLAIFNACTHKTGRVNGARAIKVKGIDRKTTRELRRAEREIRKSLRPKHSVVSRVFGGLIGLIIGVAFMFIVAQPLKMAVKNTKLENIYEYTIYGQFDKVTNNKVSEFIIGENK